MRSMPVRRKRLLAFAAIALAAAAGGCKTLGTTDTTGSTGSQAYAAAAPGEGAARRDIDVYGARYRSNPADAEAAIRYAQALREIGQRAQASAVLEQASMHDPKNKELLGAYGRALADNGDYRRALDVLARAHSPDQPDWRILNAQGAVLDQMGRPQEAQRHYASALRLVPDEPSVLSNLGLSYALSKDLPHAEQTLRRAVAQRGAEPKVRQNLALVVGLQGRFAEAEAIASADLSPEDAAANVAYLREMLSRRAAEAAPARKPRR